MTWLSDWGYRKSHVIGGSTEDASINYQVRIKVHYGSGTDSTDDVYCSSHCRTDFGDIRFTNSDKETELSYFIEEKVNSDYAYIWIKITDDLHNLSSTIYIYYGKASETTTSNGTNTFILFDDFETWEAGGPTGWIVSGSWSYEAGCAKCTSSGSLVRALAHENVAMVTRGKVSANDSNYYGLTHYLRSNVNLELALRASWWHHDYYTPHLQKTLDVWWYTAGYQFGNSTASAFDINTFYIFNFGIFNVPNSGQLADIVYEFNHDSKTLYARTIGGYPCGTAMTGTHIGLTVFTCSQTYPAYIDWVAIRRFVYPEPFNDVWGTEEVYTYDYGVSIGSLWCHVIGWEEKQECNPAIRDVIKDSNGSVVDTGTYVTSNRVLEILIRISDTQLTTLNAMFAENAVQTIVARTEGTNDYPRWTYTAWFAKPYKKYECKKDDLDDRKWIVELVFYCSSHSYAESAP